MNRREFIGGAGALGAVISIPQSFAGPEMQKMATRPIPATGESLPIVGLGNSQPLGDGDYEHAKKLLDVLVDHGGSFVDAWGGSQGVLGRYMYDYNARSKLFLGNNIGVGDADDFASAVRYAKDSQGKAVLDLLQLPNPPDLDRQWRLFRDAKEAGHCRYIGLATARPRLYDTMESLIRSGTADFIQVNYSILETETGERILPLAMDHGVAVITNRPFVNGQYFPLIAGKELPDWAAEFDCRSWAQFSLKFILANPAVTCVITETSKTRHAVDNLSAGFGPLPDEETKQRMQALIREFLATSKHRPELRSG